jgi:hypothetical protein
MRFSGKDLLELYRRRPRAFIWGILGAAGLLLVGQMVWSSSWENPWASRRKTADQLNKQIHERETKLANARATRRDLNAWQNQSLPANIERARSGYQAWLLGVLRDPQIDLARPAVTPGEMITRKGLYQVLTFSVRGAGSLRQLTQFLYEFYTADCLHLVRSLDIKPVGPDLLDLSLSVEAMVLPKAEGKSFADRPALARLTYGQSADYQGMIADRNLFGPGGGVDPLSNTVLTMVTSVDGVPEAWLDVRTGDTPEPGRRRAVPTGPRAPDALQEMRVHDRLAGKRGAGAVLTLHVGDKLKIGVFEGVVAEIDVSDCDVVIETEDRRWLLTLGESLSHMCSVPPVR